MSFAASPELIERIRPVKLLLLDVDGVLTDCRVFLDANGDWKRFFSIRDGYGIKRIMDAGYEVGVITGSKAKDIEARVKALGLQHFFEGTLDKKPAFEKILGQTGLQPHEVAYMGDDDFDVPVLSLAGFAATVPEAMDSVLEKVHYFTRRPGGNGAVREFCELILNFGAYSRGSS
jgi:3-deoxy-D-manno-octulosonate 8-phosphate phosphatase (KDO 8-P phosphatase)